MKGRRRGNGWLLLAVLGCADAVACSCLPEDAVRQRDEAALVFVGYPVKIEEVPMAPPPQSAWQRMSSTLAAFFGAPSEPTTLQDPGFLNSVRVTFEVSEYSKGKGPRRIQIMTGYGDADCGLKVELAKRYSIYARQMEGALRTSYCFGSDVYVRPREALPSCKNGDQ
jgi:hypothetical protein